MTLYVCDPHVELTGQSALSLLENINYRNIEPIVKKHGLTHIDPQGWYPLQSLLNVLKDISHETGATFNFVSIGMAAANLGVIPPEMASLSLAEFLTQYGKVYKMRHRNGDAGSVKTESVGEKHLKVTLDIPYPDDIFYGVVYGYARRFLPEGTHIVVKYDDDLPRASQGGDYTVLHVMWE